MKSQRNLLSMKKIVIFWLPLAATWLMMSIEGPFLAAVIARLTEPKYNLAAYGVAFSFALIIEAPVIMIMSASTALVKDRHSYLKLRNFANVLNVLLTLLMLLLLIPNIFYIITEKWINLPKNVARLTYYACIILLPWPGAIGYRRFYQGILIRRNLTRRVAYGTIIRLLTMSTVALISFCFLKIEGAMLGALALSMGVSLEAIASRIMAHHSVKYFLNNRPEEEPDKNLSYSEILNFYYPLALTSMLGLGVHPMVTFFMGQSRMALESLAVFPVVNSLVFIFRGIGLSYQEVGIALLGKENENYELLKNFATILGFMLIVILSIIAFTPLSAIWYHQISGLSLELTQFSALPTQIMSIMPGLTILLSFQRSVLVNHKKTTSITVATLLEVTMIILILYITTRKLDFVGIVAAAIAFILGRLLANGYLFIPYFSILKKDH
jgi:Na+-driven multidrug efflux pump